MSWILVTRVHVDADEFDPEAGFATKENDEEEEDLAVKVCMGQTPTDVEDPG